LTDVLSGIYPGQGWAAKTDMSWADGTLQEIWGPGTPKFFYKEIAGEDAPEAPAAPTYNYLKTEPKSTVTEAKRVSPSSLSDDDLVKKTTTYCLNDDGHPFSQLITKATKAKDDEVGTCIHNIFAAFDPESPRTDMVRMAEDTIVRHGLKAVLTSPDAIISSIETLCGFLTKAYGKAVRIEHEFPFRELRDGQMTIGSIDLVWYTSSDECVLVDFKNLPNAGRNVLAPADNRFLGHYAPQQRAYRDALTRGGLSVKACLIYLAMQGKIISLNN
jgi:ATP-dependent exoDNAse (exonuclease V) beta subunit